jgi:hypothetical protein
VPIYPPARLSQIEEHVRRHAGILSNAEATILITVLDRPGLEARSCECYQVVKTEFDRLLPYVAR